MVGYGGSEMVISFVVDDTYSILRDRDPKIAVHNGKSEHIDGHSVIMEVNVSDYLSEQNKNGREYKVPPSIVNAVRYRNTPEWYSSNNSFRFIKETVEGQHLLEHIVSRFGSVHKLNLPKPKYWADRKNHINELNDSWSESVEYEELSLDDIDENISGGVFDTYIYTLKLVDVETDEDVLYVGKSKNISNRMRQHINQGGDFSYPKKNNLVVLDIVSIKPIEQISEREQYRKVCSENPNKIVCGGK